MLEAVKVRLDPSPMQERRLLSHAGAARFAFNAGLAHVMETLESKEKPEWSFYGLRKWWNLSKDMLAVNALGQTWWRENSKEAYSSGLESLAAALSNFSKSRHRKRKGRKIGFPKFKSKDHTTPRFAYTTGSFGLVAGDAKALRLPHIGRVHCMEDITTRIGDGKTLRMTVSKHGGRWYASLTVERPDAQSAPPKGGSIGIDLGVKTLATLSNGIVIENPHRLRSAQRHLRGAQQAFSRKLKGSNRRRKAVQHISRLHEHVASQRRDLLHKTTTMIARTYMDISIEDLNVAGMVGNHRLAQAVEDASFHEFRRQLEYKTARTGARLHIIDRWYPSSKTCSNCGTVKTKLPLAERTYVCEHCGRSIDRDLNAAINIKLAGSSPESLNARGGDVSHDDIRIDMPTPVKREPSCREQRHETWSGRPQDRPVKALAIVQ